MFAALTLRLKFPSRGSDRKIDGNRRHDDEKTPKKYTREIIKDTGAARAGRTANVNGRYSGRTNRKNRGEIGWKESRGGGG